MNNASFLISSEGEGERIGRGESNEGEEVVGGCTVEQAGWLGRDGLGREEARMRERGCVGGGE